MKKRENERERENKKKKSTKSLLSPLRVCYTEGHDKTSRRLLTKKFFAGPEKASAN